MSNRTAVLKAIKDLGRPTIREIATEVGISGPSVYHHMEVLKDEGLITWTQGRARTIELTEEGQQAFQTASS